MIVTDELIKAFVAWYRTADHPEYSRGSVGMPIKIQFGSRGKLYAECIEYLECKQKSDQADKRGDYTHRSMYNYKANCVLDRIEKLTNRNYGKDKDETGDHLRP